MAGGRDGGLKAALSTAGVELPSPRTPGPRGLGQPRRGIGRSGVGGRRLAVRVTGPLDGGPPAAGQVLDSKCIQRPRCRGSETSEHRRLRRPSRAALRHGDLLVAALLLVARGRSTGATAANAAAAPASFQSTPTPGRRSPSPSPGPPPSPRRARCRCSWPTSDDHRPPSRLTLSGRRPACAPGAPSTAAPLRQRDARKQELRLAGARGRHPQRVCVALSVHVAGAVQRELRSMSAPS